MNQKDNEMPEAMSNNLKVIGDYFGEDVEYWDGLYDGTDFLTLHMADRKKIVLEAVEKYSTGKKLKILDLGCGTGVLARELLKKGHTVVASDCAKEMLDKLMIAVKDSDLTKFLGSIRGYAQETSFSTGCFDGIICIGVFQYQTNDSDLLKEISRILKKGGFCVYTIPNLLRLNYCLDPFYYCRFGIRIMKRVISKKLSLSKNHGVNASLSGEINGHGRPYDKKYFMWQLNSAIAQHGLRVREIVGFGFGPPTLLGKQILPDGVSYRMSTKLDRLMNKLQFLKLFSNRWAFVLEKL
jgi:ubiquinone/menaquinone biosynthesis C-methylase UbiE